MILHKFLPLVISIFLVGITQASAQTTTVPEYHLKVSTAPNILYITGSGFFAQGTVVTLDKAPEQWQDYEFIGWKIDGIWASENPPTIVLTRNMEALAIYEQLHGIGKIKIDTIPRVSSVTVDGTIFLPDELPLTYDWSVGSTHSIILSDVEKQSPNTRFKFDSWKDLNQEIIRTITVDDENTDFIAIYKTQHYLKPISEYGIVLGGGWQDAGSTVSFEIESDVVQDKKNDNIRYVFNSWNLGDYLNSPTNIIDVEEPITVQANWDEEFKLDLKSNIPEYNLFGTGWYQQEKLVALIAEETLESPKSDIQYIFEKWVSKGPNPVIIPNAHVPATTISMLEPFVIEAHYKKSYLVNVWTPYGSTLGSGYYPEGATAEISISQTDVLVEPNRIKKIFGGWDTHGARTVNFGSDESQLEGVSSAGVQNLLVFVNNPSNITAKWKTQYFLNVESSEGTVEGSGWYDLGRLAPIKVTQLSTPAGFWSSQTFDKWGGDIDSDKVRERVVMNGPKTVIAEWKEDQTAGIMNSLVLAGVAAVGAVIFFKSRSGKPHVSKQKEVSNINTESGFDKFFNTTRGTSNSVQTKSTFVSKKKSMSSVMDWLMGR